MTRMMSFAETMAWGAAQYADVLAALEEKGLPATFTHASVRSGVSIRLWAGPLPPVGNSRATAMARGSTAMARTSSAGKS